MPANDPLKIVPEDGELRIRYLVATAGMADLMGCPDHVVQVLGK